MKEKIKVFFRTVIIGITVSLNIIFGSIAVAKAYESIRQIGFGEYKRAVEITEDGIRILDFTINF